MYILVNMEDGKIIGTANGNISETDYASRGVRVYEIDDEDFNIGMIGKKISAFDVVDGDG